MILSIFHWRLSKRESRKILLTIIFEEILVKITNNKKSKSMIRAVITYSSLEIGGNEGEQISSAYLRCNYVYVKKLKRMQTNTSLL